MWLRTLRLLFQFNKPTMCLKYFTSCDVHFCNAFTFSEVEQCALQKQDRKPKKEPCINLNLKDKGVARCDKDHGSHPVIRRENDQAREARVNKLLRKVQPSIYQSTIEISPDLGHALNKVQVRDVQKGSLIEPKAQAARQQVLNASKARNSGPNLGRMPMITEQDEPRSLPGSGTSSRHGSRPGSSSGKETSRGQTSFPESSERAKVDSSGKNASQQSQKKAGGSSSVGGSIGPGKPYGT
ncbi:MAG: hypothetical protein M1828_004469 [Chrysothrix sp. TS-e1954]|nr:MAG: hypothetical protein M1828_004469 [Chrysothrix sp. TS-e1954]